MDSQKTVWLQTRILALCFSSVDVVSFVQLFPLDSQHSQHRCCQTQACTSSCETGPSPSPSRVSTLQQLCQHATATGSVKQNEHSVEWGGGAGSIVVRTPDFQSRERILLVPFRSLCNFVHSTFPRFTQLYK